MKMTQNEKNNLIATIEELLDTHDVESVQMMIETATGNALAIECSPAFDDETRTIH